VASGEGIHTAACLDHCAAIDSLHGQQAALRAATVTLDSPDGTVERETTMISVDFTEDELVEIASETAFTAYHALEDDDDEAWRKAAIAVSTLDKIEKAYPALIESENFYAAREMIVLKRRVARRSKT